MLAMVEPNKSPTAKFGEPSLIAVMSVASSGSDVAAASAIDPTQILPSPVASAKAYINALNKLIIKRKRTAPSPDLSASA